MARSKSNARGGRELIEATHGRLHAATRAPPISPQRVPEKTPPRTSKRLGTKGATSATAKRSRKSSARGPRPSRRSTCHALVGLLTPELSQNRAFSPIILAQIGEMTGNGSYRRLCDLRSVTAAGPSRNRTGFPVCRQRNYTTDHQRTSYAINLCVPGAVVKTAVKNLWRAT
jgi:hypothetical protein